MLNEHLMVMLHIIVIEKRRLLVTLLYGLIILHLVNIGEKFLCLINFLLLYSFSIFMVRALRRGLRGATSAALIIFLPLIVCIIVLIITVYQGFLLIDRLFVHLLFH